MVKESAVQNFVGNHTSVLKPLEKALFEGVSHQLAD